MLVMLLHVLIQLLLAYKINYLTELCLSSSSVVFLQAVQLLLVKQAYLLQQPELEFRLFK